MTLRIDRIKVNRGGPLRSDFEFEPGDLNLIYGQNETGKTYVVESLIKFLFKTSNWDLRDWGIAGRAMISGLESDPVSFTTAGKKLEDYWKKEGTGLPPDVSRLLVVRAGETLLAETKDGDGVGRDMLKDYLSGEGLLDRVADNVEKVIRRAAIQDRQIVGPDQGKLNTRNALDKDVDRLQTLLDDIEAGYTSGDAHSLRQQKKALDAEVEALRKAERHHASQLDKQIEELKKKKGELPTGEQLGRLKERVKTYESNQKEIRTESAKLEELTSTTDNFQWADKALGVYKDVTSGAAGGGPKKIFVRLALLSLAGAATFSLLGILQAWNAMIAVVAVLVLSIVSGLFVIITYRDTTKALSSAGENTELEKLKAEYRTRFGSDLTDRAALEGKLQELQEGHISAKKLKENLDKLSDNTLTLERTITETLITWTDTEVPVQDWRDCVQNLEHELDVLQEQIGSTRQELTSVAIPPTEYLDEHPGTERNPERYTELSEKLQDTGKDLEREENKLETLKVLVSHETGREGSDWEELITVLRDKREEAAEKYRELTAEILAKIQVYKIIEDLRKQENSRIAKGLKREELTEPLHALTGRYRSIQLDDDGGLVLVTDEDEDYRLADLSTGAREQIFLALRMGFASIAMEGKTGFLILDDAFQDSDWDRRENLVSRTVSFVKSGWQVFYFTMDDHIRDLFQNAGDTIGNDFRSHRLG